MPAVCQVERGLPYELARQVAVVLTEKDVIRAHARDELGIGEAVCGRVVGYVWRVCTGGTGNSTTWCAGPRPLLPLPPPLHTLALARSHHPLL